MSTLSDTSERGGPTSHFPYGAPFGSISVPTSCNGHSVDNVTVSGTAFDQPPRTIERMTDMTNAVARLETGTPEVRNLMTHFPQSTFTDDNCPTNPLVQRPNNCDQQTAPTVLPHVGDYDQEHFGPNTLVFHSSEEAESFDSHNIVPIPPVLTGTFYFWLCKVTADVVDPVYTEQAHKITNQ
ncbi:hypothetical protein P879_00737 [Paragonimus westermani]|uniref:Uncharacterized protein n=1 Tax=Paragonimus westermani TaxID=34504 RepID=A0A8T0D1E1_9TREM|nr:hypothetical protein P879_00737 [Paragonimus westermani]